MSNPTFSRGPERACPDPLDSGDTALEWLYDHVGDASVRQEAQRFLKRDTIGDLANAALDVRGNRRLGRLNSSLTREIQDEDFIQRLTQTVITTSPPEHLDAVTFTFSDRVAAWVSGMGHIVSVLEELRLTPSPAAPADENARCSAGPRPSVLRCATPSNIEIESMRSTQKVAGPSTQPFEKGPTPPLPFCALGLSPSPPLPLAFPLASKHPHPLLP